MACPWYWSWESSI